MNCNESNMQKDQYINAKLDTSQKFVVTTKKMWSCTSAKRVSVASYHAKWHIWMWILDRYRMVHTWHLVYWLFELRISAGTKGDSPEVLVTLGLGGWVSLGPYFFFRTSKKYYILGCIYRLLAQFGHKNWTNQRLVPCGRVPILKVPYWNVRTMAIRSFKL